MPLPHANRQAGPIARKVAIAGFVSLHALALVWWNFAVFGMPPRDAEVMPGLVEPLRQGAKRVETRLWFLDRPTRLWIALTGSWQNWEMFAEPTRERSMLVLEGVLRYEGGDAIHDPTPVLHSRDETYESFYLRNSAPPCGFRARGDRTRDRELLTRYVDYHLFRHERRTGVRYVGARYVCYLSPLPLPPGAGAADGTRTEARTLWESRP